MLLRYTATKRSRRHMRVWQSPSLQGKPSSGLHLASSNLLMCGTRSLAGRRSMKCIRNKLVLRILLVPTNDVQCEGQLTATRMRMVCNQTLAEVAVQQLELDRFVLLPPSCFCWHLQHHMPVSAIVTTVQDSTSSFRTG